MKNKKIFAFRVDVSKYIGLGHLKRLIILKKKMGLKKVFWLVKGDKKIFFDLIKKNKNVFFSKTETKMINFAKKRKIDKVIMDISHSKNLIKNRILEIQKEYINHNFKLISFDDPYQKIISNISIVPYVISKPIFKKNKKTLLFKGQNFFLHDIRKNKEHKTRIKNILIVISGTDPKNIAIKIYKILEKLDFNLKVILGENFKKNFHSKIKKNHSFLKRSKTLNREFQWSDLVICGEGHVKYESVLANKPTIIVNQYDHDNKILKDFINLNVCFSLGNYKSKKKNIIKSDIINYINNYKKRMNHKKNIKKYFNHSIISKKTNLMIRKMISL